LPLCLLAFALLLGQALLLLLPIAPLFLLDALALALELFRALRGAVAGVSVRPLHGSTDSVERFLAAVRG